MALLRRSKSRGGISPFKAGILLIILIVVASYFAFTRANPFSDPYEMTATFNSANNLQPDSPVRIAGVEVGTVTKVVPLPDGSGAAQVTMQIKENGLPLHEDAELKIRPRIFLEGNFFVDIQPGSPSAPILDDGAAIPVNQTATPVQFGEVLAALQSDTRADLRTIFEEYGFKALQGDGAAAFNRSIKYWEDAYRSTALANDALLGTQEGDLQDVLRGQQKTFAALSKSPEDLQGLVTNFNVTAAAFAREDDALQATVPALRDVLAIGRPALASLNDTLPGVQRFARDALPGVKSSGPTIEASFPFIHQTRLLFSKAELRGLVDDLRPTIPALARVNRTSIPLLNNNRALSRCTNEVLLPFLNDTDWEDQADPKQSGEKPFKQIPRSLTGLTGESRIHDGNSPLFRALFLGGLDTVVNQSQTQGTILGATAFPVRGAQPAPPLESNGTLDLPEHRPDVPCEDQVPPDLNGADIPAGELNSDLSNVGGDLPPSDLNDVNNVLGGTDPPKASSSKLDEKDLPSDKKLEEALKDLSKQSGTDFEDISLPSGEAGAP